MKATISDVQGLEVLDSRPNPTVAAFVMLSDETEEEGRSPSGASTGVHEMHELRDKDPSRYRGKGVQKAVENINKTIAPALIGLPIDDLGAIDAQLRALDLTDNLGDLGANATTAVSWACAKAGAKSLGLPLFRFLGGQKAVVLPVPLCKAFDGGEHAGNNLTLQEFMFAPVGAETFSEAVRWLVETFHVLGSILKDKGLPTTVGDEGGYAPDLSSNRIALELMAEAIERAHLRYGTDMCFALDPAASSFMEGARYRVEPDVEPRSSAELIDYWAGLIRDFPIVSIEDGMGQDDLAGWRDQHRALGASIQLIGDDLFVTNRSRLALSLPPNQPLANGILIKVNQIGTVTDAAKTADEAAANGLTVCVSQRSGETGLPDYADLCVGLNAGFIKPGSVARMDRGAIYNRLLRIEQILGPRAIYQGWRAFTSVPALYARAAR